MEALTRRLILFFAIGTILSAQSISQITIRDGKKYIDYVDVKFKKHILSISDTTNLFLSSMIANEFAGVKNTLDSFKVLYLEKRFRGARPNDTLKANYIGIVVRSPDFALHFRIVFAEPVVEEDIFRALKKLPEIETVGSPAIMNPRLDPNDTRYPTQWELKETAARAAVRMGGSIGAWEITKGDRNRIGGLPRSVAVIEPVLYHQDLIDKSRGGESFSLSPNATHGTAVSGIVAAKTNNLQHMASVGWETMLTPFDPQNGSDYVADIRAAADLSYVSVINMSWTLECPQAPENCCVPCPEIGLSALHDAIDYAYRVKGKILVAAAGNDATCPNLGIPPCSTYQVPFITYPMGFSEVIAVSAINISGVFPTSWNEGPKVELTAPGIAVTNLNGGLSDGTSLSTPIVAGIAALVRDMDPSLSPADVRAEFRATVEKLSNYTYDQNDLPPQLRT